MPKIEIFDPALCCSTGVCGPDVDPELTRFAKLHVELQRAGVDASRYNLSQEPGPFVENPEVGAIINEDLSLLPLTAIDGKVVKKGAYPTEAELMDWLQLDEGALRPKQPKNAINLL
ncbi:arsenite efflux transporter metallochaperone ArsD [Paenalkalicoccus suaedae]|uniref:Arsenite efflux transporter metallochaperone ArsD n=1 Tax=Paenalkalicoccus suaedae TaxID=2592382 RepID=A0A859FD54_9BACI|nr:arsenite efflux transporter metallochaperone ArsD [Paenalkalicoccus suaedae]QKS70504.1 arsenite efflux transporter metallochaperone ArsD [Paenalkalicoccus suaedae]